MNASADVRDLLARIVAPPAPPRPRSESGRGPGRPPQHEAVW